MKKALKYKEIVERKEKSSRPFYRMEEVFQIVRELSKHSYLSNHCQITKEEKKPTVDK
jgi:hypothetical protein